MFLKFHMLDVAVLITHFTLTVSLLPGLTYELLRNAGFCPQQFFLFKICCQPEYLNLC